MPRLSRRDVLRLAGVASIGAALSACAPKVVEVTRVVTEKEVVKETVVVEGTPQVVEKEVTKVVEKIVAATVAPAKQTSVRFMTNDVGWRESRYRQVLTEFAYAFPNIKIDYTHIVGDFYTLLTTYAAAGTFPDVFYERGNQTAPYARLGWIKPLTPFLDADPESDALLADFWPIQVPTLKYKDEWYIIPENVSSIALKYRPEVWDATGLKNPEGPWQFDQFQEYARALTKVEGGETKVWGFDPSWFLTGSGFAWMFLPAGIIDGPANKIIIDHPENAKMLNAIQDMKFIDKTIPRSEDLPQGLDLFASGMIGMAPSGVWEIPSNRDSVGADGHWDITYLPENTMNAGQNMTICYGAGYALGKDAKDPQAAWTLSRFLSRPDMQQVFIVDDLWALPGRQSVTDAWVNAVLNTGTQEPQHVKVWVDALKRGTPLPIHPGQLEVENLYGNMIAPIVTTGAMRAEEVLPSVQKDLQAVLDKYI
jgi:multiple sugar transport system substrate-binding protein